MNQCTCNSNQSNEQHAARLRILKRQFKRKVKQVGAALEQANQELEDLNDAKDDAERAEILSDALDDLRNRLSYLSDEG